MASLRKKPKSKYWYACFQLPDGTRVQRSTRETNSKNAQKIANDYERAAAARTTETQARRVIQEIYERVTGRELPSKSVDAFLTEWLAIKKVELAPSSYDAYKAVVTDFTKFLGDRKHEELLYLRTADIVAYRDSVAERVTASSANTKLKILRSALKSAWQAELIADNPADRVPTIKLKQKTFERRPFNLTELRRLFAAAHGEWRGMIMFGLYTGQRLGDIAALTWHNVDLQQHELRISTIKVGRRQVIPLAKPLVDFLSGMDAGDDPGAFLFPKCADVVTTKGRTSMLSAQFYEIMVAAGLATVRENKQTTHKGRDKKRANNSLTFHSLRHSATSILKNAGVSSAVVQEFIGHDSTAVSQNYTHIEIDAMRRATDLMPDLFAEEPTLPSTEAQSESSVAEGDNNPDRAELSDASKGETESQETQSEKVSRMVSNVRKFQEEVRSKTRGEAEK
jgi:integrase